MLPVRYVPDGQDGYSVRYRGREFGRVWRSDEGGWMVEFDPGGMAAEAYSERGARRLMREQVERYDLHTWWALRSGAK
jgi:hypothetical protein